MSVDYLPCKRIPYTEIMKLAIEGVSVQKAKDPPYPLEEVCVLTDGKNYLWVHVATNGGSTFTAYGMNDPDAILELLEEHFDTEFLSEHDDEFNELVDSQYREDFITIQLPTDDDPGPWTKVWPPPEEKAV